MNEGTYENNITNKLTILFLPAYLLVKPVCEKDSSIHSLLHQQPLHLKPTQIPSIPHQLKPTLVKCQAILSH